MPRRCRSADPRAASPDGRAQLQPHRHHDNRPPSVAPARRPERRDQACGHVSVPSSTPAWWSSPAIGSARTTV